MIVIMSCLPPPAGACSVQTFFVSLAVHCDSCSVGGNLTHVVGVKLKLMDDDDMSL